MTLSQEELRRTARQLVLPGYGLPEQTKLHGAHVLVIGAGGLGCPALQSLAAAGVGELTIIDDDTVDITNIHRQILFGASNVGKPKVEVAAHRLKELQPGIKINALNQRLTTDNALELFAAADIILDGSDSFSTKYLSADAAEITQTPLVWGTVLQFHGDVALFHSGADLPGCGVGLRDLFPEQPRGDSIPNCASAGVLGATTAAIGALMATTTIGFLAGLPGVEVGRALTYDAFPGATRAFTISHDPARPLASQLAANYGDTVCTIDPLRAQLLEEITTGRTVAVDIREPHEVMLSDIPIAHPENTIKLPLSSLTHDSQVIAALSDLPRAIIYCAAGTRSDLFVEKYQSLLPTTTLISLPGGAGA